MIYLRRHVLVPVFLFIFLPLSAQQQLLVNYDISFPNAVHHEAEIEILFQQLPAGSLEVRMARSSPGRYALHEFAKNVYNVRATDLDGKALEIEYPSLHQWNISGHTGTVIFRYTLFGDRADGTYNQIDRSHAHLNMPAALAYAPRLASRPSSLRFHITDGSGWTVATQLEHQPDGTYTAPDLQYLMDSPTELAPFSRKAWQVPGPNGKEQTIEVMVHHTGTEKEAEDFVSMAQKIVQEERAVFGELPAFDYGRYTFICCYVPHASGDGMEHRNSTYCTASANLRQHSVRLAGTVAHEFFHAWNVERIRPKSLEPFRFEDANMSSDLWMAEGFTSYYGDLTLRRTGLISEKDYLQSLQGDINAYLLSPGAHLYSPVQMSRQAPFVDAARSVDPHNRQNTFLSYYTYGSVLAAYLDLTLRTRYPGLTLDHYMQALWKQYGKPEQPYTLQDLRATLATVTKDASFAESFFSKHIYSSAFLEFGPLLQQAGILVQKAEAGKASLGQEPLQPEKAGLRIASGTFLHSPLYLAGLDRDDLILTIEGKKATEKNLKKVLSKHKPQNRIALTYRQLGKEQTAQVILEEPKAIQLVPVEKAGKPLTEQQKTFRSKWLDSQKL